MSSSNFGSCVVPTQRLGVDDVRRVALGVAVLARLRVEHELRERAVQPREAAAQEARSARRRAWPPSRSRAAPGPRRGRCGRGPGNRRPAACPSGAPRRCRRTTCRRARSRAAGWEGRAGNRAASLCTASSSPSRRFVSSPMPATSASSAAASSPLPFAAPICFDSALRLACRSCVRVWMSLRSRSSASKRAASSVTPRWASPAATPGRSLRKRLMSSIGKF